METNLHFFIDCEAKDFAEAFCKSVQDIQQSIAEEVKLVAGDDEYETERIKSIFPDVFNKAVSKHKINGGNFSDCLQNEQKKVLSKGVKLKELQLSRLIYTSGLAVGHFSSGELNEAFYCLSMANRFIGEYQNYNSWCNYFDMPRNKITRENFRRDTLLKLIYGMANHGYNCNHDNIKNRAIHISARLQKHSITVNNEDIIKYLREAYKLEPQWKEIHTNTGTVTETERNIMLKLILGMAIDKYDYDPNSNSNSATGEECGISVRIQFHAFVNNDTIRDCLNAAKKITPLKTSNGAMLHFSEGL